MQEEFKSADELCGPMLAGEAPPDWGALATPTPFFSAFKNYLQARSQPIAKSCSNCICSAICVKGVFALHPKLYDIPEPGCFKPEPRTGACSFGQ